MSVSVEAICNIPGDSEVICCIPICIMTIFYNPSDLTRICTTLENLFLTAWYESSIII